MDREHNFANMVHSYITWPLVSGIDNLQTRWSLFDTLLITNMVDEHAA
jgi:hypothetical protein